MLRNKSPCNEKPTRRNNAIALEPDAGRDRRQKGTAEDEMAGWHHRLDAHESG